jgi:hypothetical protein
MGSCSTPKKILYILISIILSVDAIASGIGVSPDRLSLGPSQKRILWLANPNPNAVNISISSDCDDIAIKNPFIVVQAKTTSTTTIQTKPMTNGCNSTLTVQLVSSSASGLDFVPSVDVPLYIPSNAKVHDVYRIIPSWDAKPSKKSGLLVTSAIVCIGLFLYFAACYAKKRSRMASYLFSLFHNKNN